MAIPADPMTDGFVADTRLYKHDLGAGTRETHDFGPDRHPGEHQPPSRRTLQRSYDEVRRGHHQQHQHQHLTVTKSNPPRQPSNIPSLIG